MGERATRESGLTPQSIAPMRPCARSSRAAPREIGAAKPQVNGFLIAKIVPCARKVLAVVGRREGRTQIPRWIKGLECVHRPGLESRATNWAV